MAQAIHEIDATKEAKYSFAVAGEALSEELLLQSVHEKRDRFPHVGDVSQLSVDGEFGKTGVIVTNGGGEIVAAVKHPRFIAKELSGEGHVTFGGQQCLPHIETSLERPIEGSRVEQTARVILQAAREYKHLSELSADFTGLAGVGSEPEGWMILANGKPYLVSGGELQLGVTEESIESTSSPLSFLQARAEQIITRKQTYPQEVIIADFSVLPTATPHDARVIDTGEIAKYIWAMQKRLYLDHFKCSDPFARQIMDQVAMHYGLIDFDNMKAELGSLAPWVVTASHASVGLHHRRTGNKAMWVSEQEAIAVSDIFNSNLATLAELLMMSTPMVYNMTPHIEINGERYWPRDYRSIIRYALDTTYAAPFIMSPEEMHSRMRYAVINGLTHTIDRASYLADVNGHLVSSMHGRVRNRAASSEPKNQTGRVEYTGCSSSPSIFDELARNCFLQCLTLGAYEALATGQHPIDYYREKYPSISRWQEQKDITTNASLFGFNHPQVRSLITEGITYLQHMYNDFPALQQQAAIAASRLKNLLIPAAHSIADYAINPQGSFAEVVQNELRSGKSPIEVVAETEQYQLYAAQKIKEGNGFIQRQLNVQM